MAAVQRSYYSETEMALHRSARANVRIGQRRDPSSFGRNSAAKAGMPIPRDLRVDLGVTAGRSTVDLDDRWSAVGATVLASKPIA